jgi:hypothetical protein
MSASVKKQKRRPERVSRKHPSLPQIQTMKGPPAEDGGQGRAEFASAGRNKPLLTSMTTWSLPPWIHKALVFQGAQRMNKLI